VLVQLRRRKWKWLGHTLRRSDDTTVGTAKLQRKRATKEQVQQVKTGIAGFKYSWRKTGSDKA